MQTLPPFPPRRSFATELPELPERLRHDGHALRWATESDEAFLRELYAWSRAEELSLVV